jgi:hypothetical protein
MKKIHEKHTIQKHSITFLIHKQSSRWFQLNRDQNNTKFIQKMLLKLVQQIMKGHCSQPFLRPNGENDP